MPVITLNNVAVLLLIVINIIGFITVKSDKYRAIKKRWRVPEKKLFLISILGGCLGVYAGLVMYRHKTRRWSFMLGIPLIMLIQVFITLYWL